MRPVLWYRSGMATAAKVQISAWLPRDLYQRLREVAFRRGVSRGQVIRDALAAELATEHAATARHPA